MLINSTVKEFLLLLRVDVFLAITVLFFYVSKKVATGVYTKRSLHSVFCPYIKERSGNKYHSPVGALVRQHRTRGKKLHHNHKSLGQQKSHAHVNIFYDLI